MANPIIEKFTGLVDFKVDESSLSSLNRTLDNLASRLTSIGTRTSQIAARDAIIQQRMARAEEASSRARLNDARATQTIANATARARRSEIDVETRLANATARARRSEIDVETRLARIQNDNRRLNVLEIRTRMDGLRQVGQLSLNIIENETRARLAAERTRRDAANATSRQEIQNSRERMQAERLANRGAGGGAGGGGGGGRGGFGGAGHLGIAGVIGRYAAPYLGFQGITGVVSEARRAAGLKMAFTSLTGDKGQGAEELEWLRKTTDYLGLNYLDSADQYKQIYAASKSNIGEKGAKQVFRGFGSAATVLGMNKEQTQGMFRAVGQMLNKEQVMAEELKGQLAERYAGAMDLFTRAASDVSGKKLTTKQLMKMMEKGQVGTDVVLRASQLAEEDANKGGALDERRKSDIASQARFENAKTRLVTSMYEGGLSSGVSKFFTELTNAMIRLEPHMVKMGNILGELIGFAGDLAKVLADSLGLAIQTISAGVDGLNGLFSSLGLSFSITEGGLAKLGIALWAFARHPAVAAIMAAFAAIQDMIYFMDGDANTRSLFDKKQVLLDEQGNVGWERNNEKEKWQPVKNMSYYNPDESGFTNVVKGSSNRVLSLADRLAQYGSSEVGEGNFVSGVGWKILSGFVGLVGYSLQGIGGFTGASDERRSRWKQYNDKMDKDGKGHRKVDVRTWLESGMPAQTSFNIQNLNVTANDAKELVASLQSLSITHNRGYA